jgi:hypothetical protein
MNGAFIGQHGSWNRKPLSGYKVIFVPFSKGKPSGPAEDVLTDFVNDEGDAQGRPVGVAVDRAGALLVADDVGNSVWRLQGTAPRPVRKAPQPQSQSAPPPPVQPPVQQEPPASPPPESQPPEVTSQTETPSQPAAESAPETAASLSASP